MYQGVMFDMDQTLVASNLNFAEMRAGCFRILKEAKIHVPAAYGEAPPPASLIELARSYEINEGFSGLVEKMFSWVARCEAEGMKEAVAEPGALETVSALKGKVPMTVVTNNASASARKALDTTQLAPYIDFVIGRDDMNALKPAASGIEAVLEAYPHIEPSAWVMVGDSWIDGKAANEAGVPFVSYCASDLETNGVETAHTIDHLTELIQMTARKEV
ncbi:phosphoglycolate phosphatase [Salsuginibacillus halophilus]|uniref:Phosphoglycolate phosphatase n=1 Tax=Salsuginibacillus halophilus TaxID=517424 RepID=A0A2P8HE88_9BACI|nr:HAD hydrolase-like protein [Salsuginibacillus halophilus]PSL44522.1 phosphoglycolate phosphatase [Salsuginibacillus halophilus]